MMKDRSSDRNLLPQPELYRVPDAATVLGVSERMIYTFIKDGVLVATYLPGTGTKHAPVRIARTDLSSSGVAESVHEPLQTMQLP